MPNVILYVFSGFFAGVGVGIVVMKHLEDRWKKEFYAGPVAGEEIENIKTLLAVLYAILDHHGGEITVATKRLVYVPRKNGVAMTKDPVHETVTFKTTKV